MLAIRMQRTGRSGHAQFRVIVQDSRFSPKSGRVTAYLGSYDPHTKATTLNKDKAADYLSHGAQPSERVAQLLKKEGVKLPDWVKLDNQKTKRAIRNPEKLRRNRPAEAAAPEAPIDEAPASENNEAPMAEETPVAEEAIEETAAPTEEPAVEESTPPAEETPAEAEPEAAETAPAEETPAAGEPTEEA